jgi:hypothetical protein
MPLLLRNLKIYYHVHKKPKLAPTESQLNLVHNLISYFLSILFNTKVYPEVSGLSR